MQNNTIFWRSKLHIQQIVRHALESLESPKNHETSGQNTASSVHLQRLEDDVAVLWFANHT